MKFENNIMTAISPLAVNMGLSMEEVIDRLNFEAMMNNHLNDNSVEVKAEDMDVEVIETETDTEGVIKHPGTYLAMMEELDEYMWGLFHDSYDLTYTPSKGWVKKQVRRSHILKDKAKHGYHLPRRWDFREYNRGDMERLKAEAVIKANKLQMNEVDNDEAPISDGVSVLWGVHMKDIDKSLKSVKDSEFVFMAKWAAKKCWVKVQSMMVDFYDTIDSVYPEEGMGWKNAVVNEFMDELYNYIKGTRNMVIRSIKGIERSIIEEEMMTLKEKLSVIDNDKSEDEEI